MTEHALFMKHVSDAMALRKKLFDQLEKASLPCVSQEEAASLLHIGIVGGGPTGKAIKYGVGNSIDAEETHLSY